MNTPTKTVEFLDLLKVRRGWSSDYRLGKELGWKHSTISNYRSGRSAMSGPHALKIAHELEMPEAYVLACVEAEREPAAEVAEVWRAIAATLSDVAGRAAGVILVGAACLLVSQNVRAQQAVVLDQAASSKFTAVYIMRTTLVVLHGPYLCYGSILAREPGLRGISVPVPVSVRNTLSEV